MRAIFFLIFLVATQGASAKDSRQDVMQACAQKAQDKDLTGDAHAEFMRGCLRPPPDYKAPVFQKAEPTKAPDTKALQPTMKRPGLPAPTALR